MEREDKKENRGYIRMVVGERNGEERQKVDKDEQRDKQEINRIRRKHKIKRKNKRKNRNLGARGKK